MEVSTTTDRDDIADAPGSEYRSVSALAVLAFALGLASPAALAAPLLVAVPAAAVGVGALALGKIRGSGGALTGVGLARCGIVLAVACIAAAGVRGPVRDELMRRQMTEAAHRWFDLLAEERTNAAMSMLSGQAMMSLRPSSEPGEKPVPEEEAATIAEQRFRSDPSLSCLSGKQPPLTVSVISDAMAPLVEGGRATVAGDFSVADGSGGEPCRVHVQCVRYLHSSSGQSWQIERWGPAASQPAGGH